VRLPRVVVYKEARNGLIYCALWELVEALPHASVASATAGYPRRCRARATVCPPGAPRAGVGRPARHVLRYLYIDAGVTGRDDRRPAFSRMMRRAVQGDVAAVYCYDIQRFYRNLHA